MPLLYFESSNLKQLMVNWNHEYWLIQKIWYVLNVQTAANTEVITITESDLLTQHFICVFTVYCNCHNTSMYVNYFLWLLLFGVVTRNTVHPGVLFVGHGATTPCPTKSTPGCTVQQNNHI